MSLLKTIYIKVSGTDPFNGDGIGKVCREVMHPRSELGK